MLYLTSRPARPRFQCSHLFACGFVFLTALAPLRSSFGQDAANVGAVAAKQFYREGMKAAQEEQFGRAARKFSQAIQADGSRPEYHAALSAVHVEQSRMKEAWNRVRIAMKRGGGDPRVANQLFAVWDAMGAEGLFQAGTVQSTIKRKLGEPDRVNKVGGNERWFYDFMGIDWAEGMLYSTIDLRGAQPANLRPRAQLRLDPDSRWRVEYRVADRSQSATHYYTPQEDDSTDTKASAPSERFVIQRIYQLAEQGVSARKWMEQLQRSAVRANPDVRWTIIEESDDRLVYEWSQPKTENWPVRHEVALVMTDDRDLHHAAYSDSVEQLDTEVKNHWLAIFKSATLHRYESESESIPADSLAPTVE